VQLKRLAVSAVIAGPLARPLTIVLMLLRAASLGAALTRWPADA
jgi:hypothetical protein